MADAKVVHVAHPCQERPAECRVLHLASFWMRDVNLPLTRNGAMFRQRGITSVHELAALVSEIVAIGRA